ALTISLLDGSGVGAAGPDGAGRRAPTVRSGVRSGGAARRAPTARSGARSGGAPRRVIQLRPAAPRVRGPPGDPGRTPDRATWADGAPFGNIGPDHLRSVAPRPGLAPD